MQDKELLEQEEEDFESSSKFSSIKYDDEESDSAEELDVDFDEVFNNKMKKKRRKQR